MTDTRFKVENGLVVSGSNSTFEKAMTVNANCYINGNLLFVGNDLFVSGNLTYTNTSIAGDLTPVVNGANLGNTTNRFNLLAINIGASGNVTPSANGGAMGNTVARWATYSTLVNATGTLTVSGNATFNTTSFTVDTTNSRVGINTAPTSAALTVAGSSSLGGNVTITGIAAASGNISGAGVVFGTGALFSNSAAVTNTTPTKVDSFPVALGKAAKLFMFASDSTTLVHSIEVMLVHEGTNVIMTKYAEVYNTNLGGFDAVITGANVDIMFTALSVNTYNVKTIRQQML